jgi:hypothetical protein
VTWDSKGRSKRSLSLSFGLLGRGSGGGFLANTNKPHYQQTFLGLDRGVAQPIEGGILPGSPESHKGTKLLFDEDLLRLIFISS